MASIPSQATDSKPAYCYAPFWRRFLAICYDTILVICVVWIAWQPLPFIPLEDLPDFLAISLKRFYLLFVIFAFFGWFWVHGGQTLGMRAWKIQLIDTASPPGINQLISWKQALVRYLLSIASWSALGLGFLWAFLNAERLTWHDKGSRSCLIVKK